MTTLPPSSVSNSLPAEPADYLPYAKAPVSPHAPRVVLSGYYGFNNVGDELILEALVGELKKRGCLVTVLSKRPQQTAQRFGVQAVNRYDLPAIMGAFNRSDLLISGGGGLFQDVSGPNSATYYGGLILLARLCQLPVAVAFQSVGPLTSGWGRWMTGLALSQCQFITVRDETSADVVLALTGIRPLVTADAVWLLEEQLPATEKTGRFLKRSGKAVLYGPLPETAPETAPEAAIEAEIEPTTEAEAEALLPEAAPVLQEAWTIGLSLRPHPLLQPEQVDALATFLAKLVAPSTRPVRFKLLVCQPQMDEPPLERLATRLNSLLVETDLAHQVDWVKPEGFLEGIRSCHLVFGMRFHSLVAAIASGIPVFGLIYDPKVQALLDELHLQGMPVTQLEHLNDDAVRRYFSHYPAINLPYLRNQARVALQALNTVFLKSTI